MSLVVFTAASLMACGGGSSSTNKVNVLAKAVPALNEMTVPIGALVPSDSSRFERYLKNGIYLRNQTEVRMTLEDTSDSSAASSSFSSTNIQEQGVDEADRVKYDGQYLFIATDQGNSELLADDSNKASTAIRIMQRQSQGDMVELTTTVVNEPATHINGLYLSDNVLAVLSDIYDYSIATTSFVEGFFPSNREFNLSLVNVSSPQAPDISVSYTIDGAIVDSRRIGNILYVVSSYSAYLEGVVYGATEQEKLDNYNTIMQTDINALLPKYTDANGNEHLLVSADQCYLPENATELDGFDGLVTVTAIDLTAPSQMSSKCVNAQVQGVYANQEAIYLYGTNYQYLNSTASETSVIHKFNFNNQGVEYRASGRLDGRFNWNLSNLRFSGKGEYLRVVTTSGNSASGFNHQLNVLIEDGNELVIASQLPNNINTMPIGKVSDDGKVYEDIQAVRFFGDQAYIVTFQNKDPLYVLDLADNLHPVIKGALEIPGYSAYLHPISNDILLGIGQNVDPQVRGNSTEDDDTTTDGSPIVEGAKVSLFDVSNLSSPKELASIVYPDAYTPVEFNYHALSFLTMADSSTRFAMPIERWGTETRVDENQQKYDVWYSESALALFEISGVTAAAQLIDLGAISALESDEKAPFVSGWDDRSILHDDDIYYIHGAKVWRSSWLNSKQQSGPF